MQRKPLTKFNIHLWFLKKNPPESRNRRHIPQHNKSYIWQTHSKHYPQRWKIKSISPKVRNKTRVPTFTTTIQHSFGSFGHSNQSRKRNKRNPNCKRRILIVCRWHNPLHQFSSVQSLSRVWLFATAWVAACQASLSITSSRSSLRLTSIKLVMPSSHLILCHPLLLLPPIPPSITVFPNESTLRMRWPKYWTFSFSIIPSKEHPRLISFRMDWLDLLAVQGTLKSLL